MSEQPPTTYEIGQVVNGHRWTGTVWEPVQATVEPPAPPTPPTPAPMMETPPPGKKPIWKRWWVWVLGVIVLLGIAAVAGGGGNNTATPGTSSTPTPAASSSSSSTPSDTPAQSPSSAAPTQSSAPPADNPVTQARQAYIDAYGTFTPVVKAGKGDAVIKLPAGATSALVTMTYKGSSNFIVETLDSSNQSTGFALANEIGSWRGAALYGIGDFGEASKLKVQAQGSWTIKIAPVATAPEIKFPATEKGTGVYLYVGDASDWTLTHKGTSNFIVYAYPPDENAFNVALVNEIGKYAGTVPAQAGPVLISVQADGTWTIKAA